MTPELLAHAANALRESGALDVWMSQALMKKGRPGVVLHVLAATADRERLAQAVFAETRPSACGSCRVIASTSRSDGRASRSASSR